MEIKLLAPTSPSLCKHVGLCLIRGNLCLAIIFACVLILGAVRTVNYWSQNHSRVKLYSLSHLCRQTTVATVCALCQRRSKFSSKQVPEHRYTCNFILSCRTIVWCRTCNAARSETLAGNSFIGKWLKSNQWESRHLQKKRLRQVPILSFM